MRRPTRAEAIVYGGLAVVQCSVGGRRRKPVRLEINDSGSWRLIGRFDADASAQSDEVLLAAERRAPALWWDGEGRCPTLRVSIDATNVLLRGSPLPAAPATGQTANCARAATTACAARPPARQIASCGWRRRSSRCPSVSRGLSRDIRPHRH